MGGLLRMRFLGKSERVPRVPGRRGRRNRRCGRSRDGAQRCVMGTKAHDHDSECGSNACGERTATRQQATANNAHGAKSPKKATEAGRAEPCVFFTHARPRRLRASRGCSSRFDLSQRRKAVRCGSTSCVRERPDKGRAFVRSGRRTRRIRRRVEPTKGTSASK